MAMLPGNGEMISFLGSCTCSNSEKNGSSTSWLFWV